MATVGVFQIWIFTVLVFGCLLLQPVSGYHDYCLLDDDGSNPELGACLQIGEKFITEYTSLLKKSKTPDNTCKLFAPFSACIRPLLENCASVRHVLHSHWRPVIEHMQCACNTSLEKHDCHRAQLCFEFEASHMMYQSCEKLYKLDRKLRTRTRCHFLRENIHCKSSLLQSACGHRASKFGHHVSMLVAREDIEKLRCYVQSNTSSYQGFTYSEHCPSDIQTSIEKCRSLHPPSRWLEFDQQYTFIPRDGRRMTMKACKSYSQYHTCLESHMKRCPEGVQRLHSIDSDMRNYMLKMDYICTEELEEFESHAMCYKNVMRNNSLHCAMEGLKKYDNVTSYMFYCQSHNKMVLAMQQEFETIRSCIENQMSHHCGSASGSIISELVRRVFADPFRYQPDCRTHNVPKKQTTTTSPKLFPNFKPDEEAREEESNLITQEIRSRPLRVADAENEPSRNKATGLRAAHLNVFSAIIVLLTSTLWTFESLVVRSA